MKKSTKKQSAEKKSYDEGFIEGYYAGRKDEAVEHAQRLVEIHISMKRT